MYLTRFKILTGLLNELRLVLFDDWHLKWNYPLRGSKVLSILKFWPPRFDIITRSLKELRLFQLRTSTFRWLTFEMELPAQGVKSSFTRNAETSYYYYFTSLGGKIFEIEQKARCTYSNCRVYGLTSLLFDIARDYISKNCVPYISILQLYIPIWFLSNYFE